MSEPIPPVGSGVEYRNESTDVRDGEEVRVEYDHSHEEVSETPVDEPVMPEDPPDGGVPGA